MKVLISILIALAALWVGSKIWNYWTDVDASQKANPGQSAPAAGGGNSQPAVPAYVPGMPQKLEASYTQAKNAGAKELKKWISAHRAEVQDPRLAMAELDYVVLVARENYLEAKQVFAQVKERVPQDSPVYPRVKSLEKTYQP